MILILYKIRVYTISANLSVLADFGQISAFEAILVEISAFQALLGSQRVELKSQRESQGPLTQFDNRYRRSQKKSNIFFLKTIFGRAPRAYKKMSKFSGLAAAHLNAQNPILTICTAY